MQGFPVAQPASAWDQLAVRIGIGGGFGAGLGYVFAMAAFRLNAAQLGVILDPPDEAQLLLAATLAAGGGGFIALKLARRWPFTAIVVMTGLTLAMAIAVVMAMHPYDGAGPIDTLIGAMTGGLFFFPFAPLVAPGLSAFVVAGSAAWVAAARLAVTGSLRVPRTTREIARDLLVAATLCFLVWGPFIFLGITLLTGTDGAD